MQKCHMPKWEDSIYFEGKPTRRKRKAKDTIG
jgi:hypothetical protein